MQRTDDTTEVPDSKRSGSTTMRFDWFVIRHTPPPSNSPTMLTTLPGLTAVSFLTNNKLPTFTNALYSHPSKKIQVNLITVTKLLNYFN